MPKYEIMLIVDPRQLNEAESLIKEVIGSETKIKKLDKTELAYEINGTKIATYLVVEIEKDTNTIKEFTRKTNISKAIWRSLVINLDSERARNTMNNTINEKKFNKNGAFDNKTFSPRNNISSYNSKITEEKNSLKTKINKKEGIDE